MAKGKREIRRWVVLVLIGLVLLQCGGAGLAEERILEPTAEPAKGEDNVAAVDIGSDAPAQVRQMYERLQSLAAQYDFPFEVGALEKGGPDSFYHIALETYGRHLPMPELKEGAIYDMPFFDPDKLVSTCTLFFFLCEGREYDFMLSLPARAPEAEEDVIAVVLMALENDLSLSSALELAKTFMEAWPENACDHGLDIGAFCMLGGYNMRKQVNDPSVLHFLRRADFWSNAFSAEYYTRMKPEWVHNSEYYATLCRVTGTVSEVSCQPDIDTFSTTLVDITTPEGIGYTLRYDFTTNPYSFDRGKTYEILGMVDTGGVIRIDWAKEAEESSEPEQRP